MQNPFIYPPGGRALRKATASTGNVLSPQTYTIPAGGYSEVISANDCLEILFRAAFAVAATGDMVVRQVTDEVATAGETFDTEAIAGVLSWNWNAGEALSGFFHIFNNSDQSATIYHQKRIG